MTDRATKYAKKVVSEKKMGKLHIAACRRHLKDIKRQGTDEFPYVWVPAKAERVLNFSETLIISEGAEPKPLRLFPHQCFDIGLPYGWVHRDTGFRRFRRSYLSVARQNGKSFTNGIHGTYSAGFSGYHHGKLFTVATKRRQAKIAWDEMKKFIEADKDLSELFRIQEWRNIIGARETGCTIEALSREGGLDEGFRSIFTSIDELHQMKDNSIYSNLYRGTRALDETLISMITTRGDDLDSFAFEIDKLAVNVLEGTVELEDFFCNIYCADDTDDKFSDEALMKANPFLWNIPRGRTSLLEDAKTAQLMGGQEFSQYCIKTLNQWYTSRESKFILPEDWQECGSNKTLEDFRGQRCFVGIDLSSGGDLTTVSLDFPLDDGSDHFFSHSLMPRGRFAEHIQSDLAPYDVWEDQGLITLTGGESSYITDYLYLIKWMHEVQEEYELDFMGIGYDRHNISGILTLLDDFGCPVREVVQSARALNDAIQSIQLQVRSRMLRHDARNGLMTWSFANAELDYNSFGEMKIEKVGSKKTRRIDPVDAAVNAHAMKLVMLGDGPATNLDELILSDEWTL